MELFDKDKKKLTGLYRKTEPSLPGADAYDMNGNKLSGSSVTLSDSPVYIYGTNNASDAKNTEINARKSAITSKYSKVTSSMLSASNAKAQIMATSLSAKDKSAVLYMLHGIKKIEAAYESKTNTYDLTVPTVKLSAVDAGSSIYSQAALKMAESYVDRAFAIKDESFTGKDNVLAYHIMIANDLIESAKLLSPSSTPSIKNVNVSDGQLTFEIKNIEEADVWVATYSGGIVTTLQKVARDNLSCQVGASSGKIFVWNGFEPLAAAASFGE